MGKSRYIAIGPGRVDQKHVEGMGKAVYLHDFLVDHQTDADGRVNYGKPIWYGWIQRQFPGSKRRTLQRWMARLIDGGYIAYHDCGPRGFTVRILNQKKWPTAGQLPLFPPAQPVCITSGKVVEAGANGEARCATTGAPSCATSGASPGSVSISLKEKSKR